MTNNKSPYNRYNERVTRNIQLKKLSYQIVVKTTIDDKVEMKTRIKGETKNAFLDDCLLRGLTESEVLRNIIKIYYEALNKNPLLKGREFSEILHIFNK